jgi:hypothetical protein
LAESLQSISAGLSFVPLEIAKEFVFTEAGVARLRQRKRETYGGGSLEKKTLDFFR